MSFTEKDQLSFSYIKLREVEYTSVSAAPVSVHAIEIPKHWALCVLGAASRLYIRLSVSLLQPRLEMASTWCRQFRLSVSRYTKHSFFSLCFPRTVWRNSNRIVPLSWGQSREIIQRGFPMLPLFVWSYKFLQPIVRWTSAQDSSCLWLLSIGNVTLGNRATVFFISPFSPFHQVSCSLHQSAFVFCTTSRAVSKSSLQLTHLNFIIPYVH